jgi:hypothetical protein
MWHQQCTIGRYCPEHVNSLCVLGGFNVLDRNLMILVWQVLGADTHFLADAIVRAYESRVRNPPKEGFSQEALVSRQEILKGACETLADPEMRGDYNEGLLTDELRTIMVDVPLNKVEMVIFLYSNCITL